MEKQLVKLVHKRTLYGFGWIDECAGNETFLTVAANHPIPIGIFTIQNGHKFTSFDADIVFIAGDERVQNNVPPGRILLFKMKCRFWEQFHSTN